MTRWNSFARSAVFAAVAAAGWLPWVVIVGPLAGIGTARSLYLIVVLALYVAGLASDPARGVVVGVAAGAAALFAALLARSGGDLALALALILALARSAFLYRTAAARALSGEVVLQLGGLLFVRWLSGPTLVATSLALWGYLLVQSCFFLIGGVTMRRGSEPEIDSFERAHRRATAILEQNGG